MGAATRGPAKCHSTLAQPSSPPHPALQPKLKVGPPNDRFEQQADRVADQVMRMADPQGSGALDLPPNAGPPAVRRLCAACEEEVRRQPIEEDEEEELRMKGAAGATPDLGPGLQARIAGLRGGGQPLSPSARAFFEPRFGHVFSQVRIHTDPQAADSARALNALAYTVGDHIVFGAGPLVDTSAGRRLLAHELTHVVQQSGQAHEGGRGRQAGRSDVFIQRALVAPPTRFDVSAIVTSLWKSESVTKMDARIQELTTETGADGNPKLRDVEYDLGPVTDQTNPAYMVALKAALLSVIQTEETGERYTDGEYRLRVDLQRDTEASPPDMTRGDFVFAVVRFDAVRNAQVVLSSESSVEAERRGLVGTATDPAALQSELKAEYGIEFSADGVRYRNANHAPKPWEVADLALIGEALAMLGGTEKGLLPGTTFRRLAGANFNGIRGFYLNGSINFFDEALPVGRLTWVGESGREHSYGVHTTLHEIGHLLHFSAVTGQGQTDFMKLFKDAVWTQAEAIHQAPAPPGKPLPPLPRDDARFPPPGIVLPTTYSGTGAPWDDFFSDTYSIYRTNPDFLNTPTHGYLLAFFRQHFP